MIALIKTLETPGAIQVVEVTGTSQKSVNDAVWQAISQVLSRGRHLVHMEILDHHESSQNSHTDYHVKLRVQYSTTPEPAADWSL